MTDTRAPHTAAEVQSLKQQALARIDALREPLLGVSRAIHARPELAFEEHHAAALLCETAARHSTPGHRLAPHTGAFGLDTAFAASVGSSGPRVDLIAEYDALPKIGHACGHNLIATAALGASLAVAPAIDALGGRLRFLGTPAEERGGGKELMARAGAFDGVDAAMMIHPSGLNLASMPCICVAEVTVRYQGRSAHASAMPHKGINALDALLLAYQAISNLRQHIKPSERIHGIVTEGGDAPNIVPDRTAGCFYVRAANEQDLAALKPRVQACFEAGATGTGCTAEVDWAGVDYLDLNTNWPLADVFQANAESIGREFFPYDRIGNSSAGSTDMGNVSYRVPSIHPMLACAPQGVVIHHPDFAKWAGNEQGDLAALDGARALAMTAIDFLADPGLQAASREAFEVSIGLNS